MAEVAVGDSDELRRRAEVLEFKLDDDPQLAEVPIATSGRSNSGSIEGLLLPAIRLRVEDWELDCRGPSSARVEESAERDYFPKQEEISPQMSRGPLASGKPQRH